MTLVNADLPRPVDGVVLATVMVALSSAMFGFVPLFARGLTDAGVAPPAIAFGRYLLAAVVLSPFLVVRGVGRSASLWGLVAGASMGIGWVGYVEALEVLSVSTAGVYYMTYPLFTVLIGWIGFRDPPGIRTVFAGCMILAGALIATGGTGETLPGVRTLAFALMAPASFGLAINILARKLIAIPPLSRIPCVCFGALLGLLPLIATLPVAALVPSEASGWLLLLGLSIFTALMPQLIYVIYSPRIGASASAMAGSSELPTMFIVGWLLLGETLTPAHVLAGALVVTAILITPVRRSGKVSQHLARDGRSGSSGRA